MARPTKGTMLYVIVPSTADPDVNEILKIECPKNISGGEDSSDDIEDTCLEDSERSYLPGLMTPGNTTFAIDADPRNSSHVRLHQFFLPALGNSAPKLKFAIGWGDGTEAPKLNTKGDDFDLPSTRTWNVFVGHINGFPFDFQLNALVTTTVSVKRSSAFQWIPKA